MWWEFAGWVRWDENGDQRRCVCEYGNESSVSTKGRIFVDNLSYYQLLKDESFRRGVKLMSCLKFAVSCKLITFAKRQCCVGINEHPAIVTYGTLASLTLRLLMSYIYGAPILDVSRSHTTTHHSR